MSSIATDIPYDPDGDLLRLSDAARCAGVTVAMLEYYLKVGVVCRA